MEQGDSIRSSDKEAVVSFFSLEDKKLFEPILELINYDRLEGQPVCNQTMLEEALRGNSPIDNAYWQKLVELKHIYLSKNSEILGVLAYGTRQDSTGVILWSHTREDLEVTTKLVSQAYDALKDCPRLEAFPHANALGIGLEGLPSSRKITDKVLRDLGFVAEDLWLYMNCSITKEATQSVEEIAPVTVEQTKDESLLDQTYFNLKIEDQHGVIASAEFSMNGDIGTLWWLEVVERAQGKGYGRAMVRKVKSLAAKQGAEQIILFVDHDEPDKPERNRQPAISLYRSEGWYEVEHLNSYFKTN